MSEQENKDKGGYLFISHSHLDIHEIRKIRNWLEGNGFEPICFYLRCLTNDEEIDWLIKREIDAREWFLLVDSENARKSNWVHSEVDYIHTKRSKKAVTVSLERADSILPILKCLTDSMRVFLSYSLKDRSIAEAISEALLKHDFKIIDQVDDKTQGFEGLDYTHSVRGLIKDAAQHGGVVKIISKNSVGNKNETYELIEALSEEAYILSVIVDDVELPRELSSIVTNRPYVRLKTPVSPEQIEEVVVEVERLSMRRLRENDELKDSAIIEYKIKPE